MTSNDRRLHYGCEAVEQAPTIQQAQFPILCSLQFYENLAKFYENWRAVARTSNRK